MPKALHAFPVAAIGFMMLVFPLGVWFLFDSRDGPTSPDNGSSVYGTPSVEYRSLDLQIEEHSDGLSLYQFDVPVSESMIYDILATESAVWLGTGQGLIRLEPDERAVSHRAFAGAPSEWARHLTLHGDLMAVDVMVAGGPTGGQYAGTHLFNIRSETWDRIGENVADQVWLGEVLWQRTLARTLVRWTRDQGRWVDETVPLKTNQCSEASLAAIGDVLWMAQQGTARGGLRFARTARAIPCGLLRYEPTSGRETFFSEEHGMPSGFGGDVDGDASQVYVSHSTKHDRVSWLDTASGEWHSLRAAGTGNRMAVSDSAVWLATPSARHPLIRIDRLTQRRIDISGIPQDFYVSAIDVQGDSVWFGLYRERWKGETYTVQSLLGHLDD